MTRDGVGLMALHQRCAPFVAQRNTSECASACHIHRALGKATRTGHMSPVVIPMGPAGQAYPADLINLDRVDRVI